MDWTDGIAERHPVRHGEREHPRVFMLEYHDGRAPLILKVSKTDAAAKREALALRLLHEAGAPVPRLISDEFSGVLVLERIAGTPLGTIKDWSKQSEVSFWAAWKQLKEAWSRVRGELTAFSDSVDVHEYRESAMGLVSEMARIHRRPRQVRDIWGQIVELALSSKQSWGGLDYNPFNVLRDSTDTPPKFWFVDFESFGWDWDERRLWQLTTQIRSPDGSPQWRPLLRGSFGLAPAEDAHYLVFAAFALHQFYGTQLTCAECRRFFGSPNRKTSLATRCWRQLWQ